MRSLWLLISLLVALGVACADQDATIAPTAVVPEAATEDRTPQPESPPAAPLEPAIGEVVQLTFRPSDAVWVPYEPPPGESEWVQKLYNVDDETLWTLVGADGAPYMVTLSPHGDYGIARPLNDGRPLGPSRDDGSTPTVLVDFESGVVEELLPFPVQVYEWPEPHIVHVRVGLVVGGNDRPRPWQRGLYELNLEAEAVTLLQAGDLFVSRYPVPRGSELTGNELEVRPQPDEGWKSLYQVWDGGESQIAERLVRVVPSLTLDLFALASLDNRLHLFDSRLDKSWPLGRPAFWGELRWSPDGRYLAAQYRGLEGEEVLIFDVEARYVPGAEIPFSGPYTGAAIADWKPDGTELLLLNFSCTELVFDLDRVEVTTGDRVHIPTDIPGSGTTAGRRGETS